jgi:ribonucleoside-diphosphate reductase alpha chain
VETLSLSQNARTVLERRYLTKNEDGTLAETPEDLFVRVARHVASAERPEDRQYWFEQFYNLMVTGQALPNSPTLSGAGRGLCQSACFVLPVDDSIEGIYNAVKWAALVHQAGGGTGYDFSRLRPAGAFVRSTTGIASGPVSFMKVFDAGTEAIKQGSTRRGANMGILRVDHPDLDAFLEAKSDMVSLQNFNISVALTDKFLAALEAGTDFEILDPRDRSRVVGTRSAQEVWDKLIANAWKNGDPGIILLDRINNSKANPVPKYGPIESTNPCGEQPLYPFDTCTLGSINLAKFVQGDGFDVRRLQMAIRTMVRFLDNILDTNVYPLPEIAALAKDIRRIGLGVMGWADALFMLGIPYNSPEAVALAAQVMELVRMTADDASNHLALERGVFPAWRDSIYGPDQPHYRPLRNCTRTTIAPTGTISIIADCSGGIEPVFSLAFMRDQAGVVMREENRHFVKAAKERGFYSDDLMQFLAEGGHLAERPEVPDDVKRVFVTAHEISPEWHVQMQAAFQRDTDNAVSKTINFPNDATVMDVDTTYRLAIQEGCQGITMYRDGSRTGQPLSHVKKEIPAAVELVAPDHVYARADTCPVDDCDGQLYFAEGCDKCTRCDYSACAA